MQISNIIFQGSKIQNHIGIFVSVYCFQTNIFGTFKSRTHNISLCFQSTKSKHTYLWAHKIYVHHFVKQMSKPGKKQVAFMTNTFCKLCRQLISTDLREATTVHNSERKMNKSKNDPIGLSVSKTNRTI